MGESNKDAGVKSTSRTRPVTLFYSYAHEDENFKTKLEKHLSLMKRNGEIADWHDRNIGAGTEWKGSIDEHLESARIILLLVSADFLDSDYCFDIEMKRAMERHSKGSARVIPIILRNCDWSGAPFGKLQALPKDGRPIKTWSDPDEAYLNVVAGIRQAVAEIGGIARQDSELVWNVPFERNAFFTGRENELEELRQALAQKSEAALSQAQAIYGLGGIGKTQMAVEYAYRHREAYKAFLWIRADSEQSIITGYAEAARLLNLPEKDARDIEETVRAVKRWLEREESWLLIFDNADKPGLLKPYKPLNAKGHILITSRAHNFGIIGVKKSIELKKMMPEEARNFLFFRTGRDNPSENEIDAANQLAKELDYLPLALEQAGAYIAEKKARIQDYLLSYKKRRLELLNKKEPEAGGYPKSLATTWEFNFREVEEESKAAIELMKVSAFLSPDSIPYELVTEGGAKLGEEIDLALTGVEDDPLKLGELLSPLIRYSLIRVDEESESYSIHRMVQEVVKEGMNEEAKRENYKRIIEAVNSVFPTGFYGTWRECERLLEQGKAAVEMIEKKGLESLGAGRLLSAMGAYYLERGQYGEAEPLLSKAKIVYENQLGEDHPEVATSLNNLANLYYNQKRYEEAEPLMNRALKIREQALGESHPYVAISLNDLAALYYSQGRYEEAEPLYNRALKMREQALGEDHPDVAISLNNLAALYYYQGRFEEAEPLYDRALSIREQALGEDHPYVAISLNNLANLYYNQKRYEEAEPLYNRVLKIWEKTLGEDHPHFAIALKNYAALLRNLNRDAEAKEMKARAEAIKQRINQRNLPS